MSILKSQSTNRFRGLLVLALVVAVTSMALIAIVTSGGFRQVSTLLNFSWLRSEPDLPPIRPSLTEVRRKIEQGDKRTAEILLQQLLEDEPNSPRVLLLAGEFTTKQGNPEHALKYYSQIPEGKNSEYLTSLWSAGGILLHLGRLSESESKFRKVLEIEPGNLIAHRNLAFLLCTTGRRFESLPHLFALLRSGTATIEDLLFLGNPVHTVDHTEFLEFSRKASPGDPMPSIGLANIALFHGDKNEARALLEKTVADGCQLVEVQALLGRLYVETNDEAGMQSWFQRLDSRSDQHPEVWFVKGVWAEDHGEPEAAIRCYWEALQRHPDHARANYRLSQLLIARGKTEWAKEFAERAQRQEDLNRILNPIYSEGPHPVRMSRAAQLTEDLGRLWEAWAWNRTIMAHFPEHPDAQKRAARLERRLAARPPRTIAFADASMRSGLQKYPLPSWSSPQTKDRRAFQFAGPNQPVRFEEVSRSLGIDFRYRNGDDLSQPGTPIYQQLGGGIAALDFDNDAWPDLYLSQGGNWPPDEKQTEFLDKLYRNDFGKRFVDVTMAAGLGDAKFSQGVAAGDINNDGFIDLYVANIGGNRLYRNEGDGTFTEIEIESNRREDWTTSCVIADLNGDSYPDVFDVNYLDGREPFELVCRGGKSCTPNHFNGQEDQVYLGRDQEVFERVSERAGIYAPDGKGLGIVVADFDGSGRLGAFIANDTTANFFFVPKSPRGSPELQMENQAMLSGLAFDRDGRAQACMGVAIDDEDHDGLLDMYVTNFYNESNTLYKQVSGDLFVDGTREAGLREPSLKTLGFGTQYLDADLDGHADLVVTNGHVDDYTDTGAPYKMPPQFYRNRGDGRYDEAPRETLGAFFQVGYLGRSLGRFDFNRDGRADFSVIHLDAPFALLENRTATDHHFLAIQMRGLQCDRDAIGTRVTVETTEGIVQRQLTAGDGFQASNQRSLIFGLGTAQQVKKLSIRWPHGAEQSFEAVPVDCELLAIEGRTDLVVLP